MMTAVKLMRIMPPMMATGKMIIKRFLAVGDSPAMYMYNHTVGWQWRKMFLNRGAKKYCTPSTQKIFRTTSKCLQTTLILH